MPISEFVAWRRTGSAFGNRADTGSQNLDTEHPFDLDRGFVGSSQYEWLLAGAATTKPLAALGGLVMGRRPSMELHQVRYFIALCKSLNFTRAAEACNITQSALTRAIQKLEDELGGPLLQRERNLTQLSELGRLMQPLLEQSLAMADAAKDHADKFRNGEKASLHLGLPSMVYAGVARDILAEVINRLPALEVALSADSQPRMIEELLQGEVDAAFLVDDGNLPERLITWILYKE